jgi:predicted RNA binding protein YcfA (HicA-like mRNA interferase family)
LGKLKVFSGKEVCQTLERHGFVEVRRRGSHVVMQKRLGISTMTVSVPDHKEIRTGTSLFILAFAILFLYDLFRHAKFRSLKKSDHKTIDRGVFKDGTSRRKLLTYGGVLASFTALVLIITTYVLVFVAGLYYVAIASAPNKKLAVQEVVSINPALIVVF